MKHHNQTIALGAILLALGTGLGSAETIVQTANNGDWNAASQWGGTAPTTGNDYVMALVTGGNGVLRASANGANSTFGGDSLTVPTGTILLMKNQTSVANPEPNTATVNGPITFDGGLLNLGPNAATNASLIAPQFIITANGATMLSGFSGRNLTLQGTLTGVGDILINGDGGTRVITFANVSGYSGSITVAQNMGIAFGVDYTFTGGLNLTTAASTLKVNSGQTLTFAPGKLVDLVNGPVAPGIYTGATLDALGANYTNNGGTLIVGVADSPPRLTITPNATTPGTYDFSWDSQAGKLYDLVSSTDLSTAPATWQVWDNRANLVGTAPTNTLTAVPGDGPSRFFVVVEKDTPPLFSEDFEASDGGFTVVTTGGTPWAWGTPISPSQGGGAVTSGNAGSAKCWGTDIGNPGGYIAGTATALRSSVIDLTGVTGVTLSFAQALDIASGHSLVVNVIAAATDTVLQSAVHTSTPDSDTSTATWKTVDGIAINGGQPVRIEWSFIGEGDGTYLGAYIDDVVITSSP